ncbi:DUF2059 domain-containing protein [Sphingomicrobium astaxanthinifaciens]|uniref:DUF2059 domain-containing protein n=1 Tax=Sphingomicrobium astaxanthinifaciens TaxID=1227949 RepID=UPI001FCAFC1C|nr:DUF2059 domain-containing protein [Sphingomicrobium astaxanthinifaciens]MCJ7421542.1 DUF2059 domain-containing protein [Sphingomicrobium astaxanthinifaciens]
MQKLFALSASALALTIASPALAAQDSGVETVALAPSDAKIELARGAVDMIWPAGNTEYVVDYLVGPYADKMLYTPIPQLAEEYGVVESAKAIVAGMKALDAEMGDDFNFDGIEELSDEQIEATAAMFIAMLGDKSVASMIAEKDEHFDERLTIIRDVLDTELPPLAAAFDGPFRDGMARVFARQYSEAELLELAAFAATPTGRKFARNYMLIGFQPEYYLGLLEGLPAALPAMKPLAQTMTARMAHLPPMFPEPAPACEDLEEGDDSECIDMVDEEVEEQMEDAAEAHDHD